MTSRRRVLALAAGVLALAFATSTAAGQDKEPGNRRAAESFPLKAASPAKRAGASRVPSSAAGTGDAAGAAPSFVIPRDTCQQGEPLQVLRSGKP